LFGVNRILGLLDKNRTKYPFAGIAARQHQENRRNPAKNLNER
jgi:hypothetical protein